MAINAGHGVRGQPGQDRGSLMSHTVGLAVIRQHGMDVGAGKWEKQALFQGSEEAAPADSSLSLPGTAEIMCPSEHGSLRKSGLTPAGTRGFVCIPCTGCFSLYKY